MATKAARSRNRRSRDATASERQRQRRRKPLRRCLSTIPEEEETSLEVHRAQISFSRAVTINNRRFGLFSDFMAQTRSLFQSKDFAEEADHAAFSVWMFLL
ncbi:uncharacterized protein LOC144714779 [Wolffia australiana]